MDRDAARDFMGDVADVRQRAQIEDRLTTTHATGVRCCKAIFNLCTDKDVFLSLRTPVARVYRRRPHRIDVYDDTVHFIYVRHDLS